MSIRKIAAAATFATGAALAFAPLASADIDPTTIVGSEIGSLNSLFSFDALLAGDSGDIIAPIATQPFDTIPVADAPVAGTGTLDSLLYGVDPSAAGPSSDPGAYDVFNGALTQFDNAYNVELYSLANGGALDTSIGDYIYNGTIQTVLGTANETPTQAFDTLYNAGIGDLSGYFQTDLSALDITSSAGAGAAVPASSDLSTTVSSEISSLNAMFAADANLFGVGSDVVTNAGSFDTIPVGDLTDASGAANSFDYFLYGLNPIANASSDPGAYDLFNGALVNFDDAYNVELFSLLNPDAAIGSIPLDDLFGTSANISAALATDSVSGAVGEFLTNGLSDLAGYF